MSLSLFQRGLILVGVPLLLEILLISSLSFLLYQSAEERLQENKYRKFASEVASLIGYVSSAPFELASSIQSRDEKHFRRYESQVLRSRKALDEVGQIIKDIPEVTQSDYDELKKSVDAVFDVTKDIAAKRKDVDSFNTIEKMESFQATLSKTKRSCYLHLERMFDVGDEMTEIAQAKLNRTQEIQLLIVQIGIVANLLVAVALTFFFKRGISQRIGVIAENTNALARGDSLLSELGGTDEIGKFDHAFHKMLEQLAAASKNEKDLFENASDVILVLDADGKFERVSPASNKDWHYSPDELLGKSLDTILPASEKESVLLHLENVRNNLDRPSFESIILTKNSSERVGLWSAYWSSEESKMYCIVHDATEARSIENERKKFLELISSDLKIPLQVISDSFRKIGTIFGADVSPKLTEKLDMTRKNLRRLLALVNDLLLVSQMESGSFELDLQSQDLNELMRSAAADLEALLSNKQIELLVQDCDSCVFADHGRVVQVIVNLLSNAVKFSAKQSQITLTGRISEDDLDSVRIEVRDQGRGVPPSHIDKIFEKFSQVEVADGKRKAGTGLGLPICKQIIELHGGKIGVNSVENQGSTFWFTLPRNQSAFEKTIASSSISETALAEQKAPTDPVAAVPFDRLNSGAEAASNVDHKELASVGHEGTLQTTLRTNSDFASKLSRQSHEQSAQELDSARTQYNHNFLSNFFSGLSMGQKGTLLVAVPLAAEIVLSGFLFQSLLQTQHYRMRELHRRQVALTASKLSKFILYSSGSVVNNVKSFRWDRFLKSIKACRTLEVILNDLVAEDPFERKEFEQFMRLAGNLNEYSLKLVKSNLANSNEGVASLLQEKVRHLKDVAAVCTHLRNIIHEAEKKEFASPERELSQRHIQVMLLYLALFINIAFSVFLSILFSVGVSKRILVMADNARRLANDDRLNPLIGGKDELARLDQAFHHTANLLAEARRKERAVLDNSKDVLCVLSREGQFVSVNHAATQYWGFDKRELLSMNVKQIMNSADFELLKNAVLNDTAGGDTLVALELNVMRENGSSVPVLWSATRRLGQENIFCVVHDITNKRALEELRREFLAMVSHDLRTPLTSIVVVASLLEAGAFGPIPSECAEPIATVKLNVQSLLELISDILDLEKLSAGKMQLNLSKVAWSSVVLQMHNLALTLRCPFDVDISEELADELVEIDEERLVHALMSLAKYLAFHTPDEAGRSIQVSFERLNDGMKVVIGDNSSTQADGLQTLFDTENRAAKTVLMRDETFHPEIAVPLAKKIIDSHSGEIEFLFGNSGNRLDIFLFRKSETAGKS